MPRFNLISGLLALALFATAQVKGWSAFDDVAHPASQQSGKSGSRLYHK